MKHQSKKTKFTSASNIQGMKGRATGCDMQGQNEETTDAGSVLYLGYTDITALVVVKSH
jgi:hypothetical protein